LNVDPHQVASHDIPTSYYHVVDKSSVAAVSRVEDHDLNMSLPGLDYSTMIRGYSSQEDLPSYYEAEDYSERAFAVMESPECDDPEKHASVIVQLRAIQIYRDLSVFVDDDSDDSEAEFLQIDSPFGALAVRGLPSEFASEDFDESAEFELSLMSSSALSEYITDKPAAAICEDVLTLKELVTEGVDVVSRALEFRGFDSRIVRAMRSAGFLQVSEDEEPDVGFWKVSSLDALPSTSEIRGDTVLVKISLRPDADPGSSKISELAAQFDGIAVYEDITTDLTTNRVVFEFSGRREKARPIDFTRGRVREEYEKSLELYRERLRFARRTFDGDGIRDMYTSSRVQRIREIEEDPDPDLVKLRKRSVRRLIYAPGGTGFVAFDDSVVKVVKWDDPFK